MFPNKLFRNILKYSKLFPLEHSWQLSRTLGVILKHFSLRHFEMFTNLFGNFLNVKEHFEMFQWNNQKYFQTNSSENILKCSKLFFRIFLAIIQNIVSCSQTFFHLTHWNVFKLVQEHFEKFEWYILKCFQTNYSEIFFSEHF